MKLKVQGFTISIIILMISSCSISSDESSTSLSPTTNTPTIHFATTPSQTPTPNITNTSTPIPTKTVVTCPSKPMTTLLENGLTWTEVSIPDKRYAYVVPDVELLKSCLDFPKANEHDNEIYGERVHDDPISDLRIEIGDDLYETKYDRTYGCCDYDLIKNGKIILQTSAPHITTDPNRGFWNIGGKLVWELLKNPPTIIVYGVDYNEKYDLDGSYYPYEINGKLIYIAKVESTYQIVFDNEFIGPRFEEVSKAYCCAGMSVVRGGGQYWFIGKHDGAMYIVLIQ